MKYLLCAVALAVAATFTAPAQAQTRTPEQQLAHELSGCEESHQERLRRARNVARTTPESLRMLEACRANARRRYESWKGRIQRREDARQQ